MSVLQWYIGNPEIVHRVKSPKQYRAYAQAFIDEELKKQGLPLDERTRLRKHRQTLKAYISDGRWVASCVVCNGGPSAHPVWKIAICLSCGTEYAVEFPTDWKAAEGELLKRPNVTTRHYFPDEQVARKHNLVRAETVTDLRTQNSVFL